MIKQTGKYDGRALMFNITLSENQNASSAKAAKLSVPVSLSLRQLRAWTSLTFEPIRATFFFASSHPTYFLAKPPKFANPDGSSVPILALRELLF